MKAIENKTSLNTLVTKLNTLFIFYFFWSLYYEQFK